MLYFGDMIHYWTANAEIAGFPPEARLKIRLVFDIVGIVQDWASHLPAIGRPSSQPTSASQVDFLFLHSCEENFRDLPSSLSTACPPAPIIIVPP